MVPKIKSQKQQMSEQEDPSELSTQPEIIASFSISKTIFNFFKYPQVPDVQYISINRIPSDESALSNQLKGLGFSEENMYLPFLDVLHCVENHTSCAGDQKKISPSR